MILPTQPIRDEHCDLLPHVEIILRVADSVEGATTKGLLQTTSGIYDFLENHLIPHAYAEDQALYPYVEKVMDAPHATDTMRRDHIEVARLTEQLGNLREQLARGPLNTYIANELRRVLYGLYALLKVHFAKEEEVYLPVLDAKSTHREMSQVYRAMEKAAEKAKFQVAR